MNIQFQFLIPSPLQWTTSQVANIIALLGTLATLWTLIYAIRQGNKNSKRINDLAEITKQLADQNSLIMEQNQITKAQLKEAALPIITPVNLEQKGDSVWITLHNDGKRFKASNLRDKFNHYRYITSGFDVLADTDFIIYCTPNQDKKIEDCSFRIIFEYQDIYANRYEFMIGGKGATFHSYTHHEIGADSYTYE